MKFEASVQEIIVRTYNVKSFRFPRPPSLSYKSGQYMMVTVKCSEEDVTKPFTISSSPTERGFIEFTKKLTGHEFSKALDTLKVGDRARIDAPRGTFTFEGEYAKVAMLAGGIGITPMRSICRYCTDIGLSTKVTLLYGNRAENDIVFRKELEEMQEQNRNLRVVFTLDKPGEGWTGLTGRINAEMVKSEVPDYLERVFYICGPPAMVEAMVNLLEALDVPPERAKRESFLGY